MDKPSIGILLCREKNRVIAEYALRDMAKPMAISTYHLGHTLPPQFQEQLPDANLLKDLILKSGTDSPGLAHAGCGAQAPMTESNLHDLAANQIYQINPKQKSPVKCGTQFLPKYPEIQVAELPELMIESRNIIVSPHKLIYTLP